MEKYKWNYRILSIQRKSQAFVISLVIYFTCTPKTQMLARLISYPTTHSRLLPLFVNFAKHYWNVMIQRKTNWLEVWEINFRHLIWFSRIKLVVEGVADVIENMFYVACSRIMISKHLILVILHDFFDYFPYISLNQSLRAIKTKID